MPKNISYLGFPQNVQFFSNFMQLEYGFFPFTENLWTFLKKIFHKNALEVSLCFPHLHLFHQVGLHSVFEDYKWYLHTSLE